MQKDYWLERWERGDTGFQQDEINPYLRQYWPELNPARGGEVFVPLCGKSRDMRWLREQGHSVLGVELSAVAVQAFFDENDYIPHRVPHEKFDAWEADGIRILHGDFFALVSNDLRNVAAVYDRASLIALPPEMRERYASHMLDVLPPSTPILLVTLDYPHLEMSGPPFPVFPDEVAALYGKNKEIRLLAQMDVLDQNPRFRERGLTRLRESIFLLTSRY